MRRTPKKVVPNTLDNLPNGMLKEHGDVTIAINTMYINRIPFMMTTSRAIHFGMVDMIEKKPIPQSQNLYNKSLKHITGEDSELNTYLEIDNALENIWKYRA